MSEFEDSVNPQPEPGARGIPPRPPKKTARGLMDEPEEESIIDEIVRRLSRYPQARIRRGESSISSLPLEHDGFVVSLKVRTQKGSECYLVCYKGSQVEFSSRKAAVMEFGFGLSNGCRLKEYSRQGKAYRWIVEHWDEKEGCWCWKPDWDFMPWSWTSWKFWLRPEIRYLQNRLIDLDSPDLSRAA